MTLSRNASRAVFALLAAVVYTAVFFILRTPNASAHPVPVGLASLFDLTVTVPALFWLLLIRPGFGAWPVAVGLALTGARVAGWMLPAPVHVPGLRWLGAPLELWVVASVLRGRNSRLASLVRAELSVFYYALFSWRAQPESKPGYRAFSIAEAAGYGQFALLIGLALLCEGVPVHLLVHRASPTAAWVVTALDVYGLFWVAALWRSVQLRPILAGESDLVLQAGFLWRVEIPRAAIVSVRRSAGSGPDRQTPGYLRLTVLNEPQWLVELAEPAEAHGPLGRRRRVSLIGIAVDDCALFSTIFDT